MSSKYYSLRFQNVCALVVFFIIGLAWTARFWRAEAADGTAIALQPSFEQQAKPFLEQNCVRCHNGDITMSGVRVDQLDAGLEDPHLRLWEAIRKKIGDETMPPKDQPQPTISD